MIESPSKNQVARPRSYVVLLAASHLARGMALIESIFQHEDAEHRIFGVCVDEVAKAALETVRMPQLVPLSLAALAPGESSIAGVMAVLLEAYPEVETLIQLAPERYLTGSAAALAEGAGAVELWCASDDGPVDPGLVVARRQAGGLEVLRDWAARSSSEPEFDIRNMPGVNVSVDVARVFGGPQFVREDIEVVEGAPSLAGRPILSVDFLDLQMFSPDLFALVDGLGGAVSGGCYRACVQPYVDALARAAAWERGVTGAIAGLSEPSMLNITSEIIASRGIRGRIDGYQLPHRRAELGSLWDVYLRTDYPARVFPEGTIVQRPPCPVSVPLASSASPRTPRVSALVSTYAADRVFRGCLDDLVSQTLFQRGELEVIVVDSASPGSELEVALEYVQRYENISVVRSPEREGVYMAWNRAASLARGAYLTNANTDDRHAPDALERLADRLDAEPSLGLVYADSWVTHELDKPYDKAQIVGRLNWRDHDSKSLLAGCHVGPHPMWRRDLHARHGWFDGRYVVAGDYDMWLRFAEHCPFFHVKEPLGLYVRREDSVEHANRERCQAESGTLCAFYQVRAGEFEQNAGSQAVRRAASQNVPPVAERASLRACRAAEDAVTTDSSFACTAVILLPSVQASALRCLESFVANTPRYIAHEVLVLVEAPTEEVSSLLGALGGEVRVIEFGDGDDVLDAYRFAAVSAKSSVVVLLDGETTVTEGWLDPLLRTLELESDAGAAAGRRVVMGGGSGAARERVGAIAVRRELLEDVPAPSGVRVHRHADAAVQLFRSIAAREMSVSQAFRSSVVAPVRVPETSPCACA